VPRSPFGSVGYENEANDKGQPLIWLEDAISNPLGAMRGPGESHSDIILWIAAAELRAR
jgi:hypothetical protein